MGPRIDNAEVISFRLKVPRLELERLPQSEAGKDLGLTLTSEEGELALAAAEGDSYLRFRPIGPEAMLTDIYLFRDARGEFLLRVLGPLMVRFAGDLELRAVWSVAERNSDGDYAHVKITRGITDYPGLLKQPTTESRAGAEGSAAESIRNTLRAGGQGDLGDRYPEEKEVRELLEKARAYYQEYLRLKNEKK
ncbi:MAG: hypothetical protein WBV82_01420 [Myxococcaceae bacterium]